MFKNKPALPSFDFLSLYWSKVSRHLAVWLTILMLASLAIETVFIFSRTNDPNLEQKVTQKYPVPRTHFNQAAIDRLEKLTPQPTIAPATGKKNPFVP